ncbi:hypothetical protein AMC90_PD00759 (plasmid) [Rhizobium phaseoli]|nr:hypothetical protein AMC90_PD00759 [Rhizobium phaseoli]
MPVLIFTMVVLVVMIVYASISYSTGVPLANAIAWGFVFAAVLEAGNIFTHILLYAFYTRRANEAHKRTPREMQSKFPAD